MSRVARRVVRRVTGAAGTFSKAFGFRPRSAAARKPVAVVAALQSRYGRDQVERAPPDDPRDRAGAFIHPAIGSGAAEKMKHAVTLTADTESTFDWEAPSGHGYRTRR